MTDKNVGFVDSKQPSISEAEIDVCDWVHLGYLKLYMLHVRVYAKKINQIIHDLIQFYLLEN